MKDGGADATWDEEFSFYARAPEREFIFFDVKNGDSLTHDSIGTQKIPLNSVGGDGQGAGVIVRKSLTLLNSSGMNAGTLTLYFSEVRRVWKNLTSSPRRRCCRARRLQ